MKKIKLDKLIENGKSIFLTCDQGLEHGPIDFNISNIDPNYLLYIAIQGKYNAIVLNKGIAEKYHEVFYKKIPLIIKLNGKTNIYRGFPIAKQNCSVKQAIKLGADAVGYTFFLGSPLEPEIISEFGKIQEEAHNHGLPVIVWMQLEGRYIVNELSTSMLSYASRLGLELGADMMVLKFNDKIEDFKWIVRCAGKVKIMIQEGPKMSDKAVLMKIKNAMGTGIIGMAAGREVWQHETPMKMTIALQKIIIEEGSVYDSLKLLE